MKRFCKISAKLENQVCLKCATRGFLKQIRILDSHDHDRTQNNSVENEKICRMSPEVSQKKGDSGVSAYGRGGSRHSQNYKIVRIEVFETFLEFEKTAGEYSGHAQKKRKPRRALSCQNLCLITPLLSVLRQANWQGPAAKLKKAPDNCQWRK